MAATNIFAYTALGAEYPEYVSLNQQVDGTVTLDVRGPRRESDRSEDYASYLPGHTVRVVLRREQLTELACQLVAFVADKA